MTDYAQMSDAELSAAVAERVMGWRWTRFEAAHFITPGYYVRRPYPPHPAYASLTDAIGDEPLAGGWDSDLPLYASDIRAAFEVMEKIWAIDPTADIAKREYGYRIGLAHDHMGAQHLIKDASLPRAICRAALSAVASAPPTPS